MANRLASETSPYLRQHADNPVDWFPWGDEAFAEARSRDVPVLLSVGYSSCHWCHVMAHESFEDVDVAAVMNAGFVNVKVDREERPDVDAVYMDAVNAMTGQGGWPMTVFLAPDGRPFWGGTYFPKDRFVQVLDAVRTAWHDKRGDVLGQADQLTEAITRSAALAAGDALPGVETLNAALPAIANAFDPEWGGFGTAPKFPSTMSLELVLRAMVAGAGDGSRAVLLTSLDAMASGGLYDHVGGGFARYSTDRQWLVPHFEKMLYDQALLARLYLHAFQVTGLERYLQIAGETVDYVLRDLRQPGGGFASAEDADSPDEHGHGHEGLFHTWTPAEVRSAVGDAALAEAAIAWFGITPEGNFEGRSIPNRVANRGDWIRPDDVERARLAMFAAREQRRRPGLDDKVLTEWNALFLATLAEAAAVVGHAGWRDAAVANGEFLVASLRRADGRWMRSWQTDGGARHLAFAADHAALVNAFVWLHRLTGEARWVEHAVTTADAMLDLFWDPSEGGLYTTGDDAEQLVVRQKDFLDNATPSANSLAANGLLLLSALTGELRYANHAERILKLYGPLAAKHGTAFGHLLAAVHVHAAGVTEIVVAGDRPDLLRTVHGCYLPASVLTWGERFDSPLWEQRPDGFAYVCRNFTCDLPAATPEEVLARLGLTPVPGPSPS